MQLLSSFLATCVVICMVTLCHTKKKKSGFEKIMKLKEGSKREPVVLEGDILVTNTLLSEIGELKRKTDGIGVFDALNRGRWPDGIVPYMIKGKGPYGSPSQIEVAVYNAVDEYKEKLGGCIKWVEYPEYRIKRLKNYVTFFRGQGCYSSLGMQPRPQVISLQVPGCTNKLGTAVHEMMHCLGFFHEQSRIDRDNYITINWNNINQRMRYNFEKYRPGEASTHRQPYDYKSIMHYGEKAFSNNGKQTIRAKYFSSDKLGQREGLSEIDIKQLREQYKCSSKSTSTGTGVVKPKPKPKKKRVWCGDTYSNCVNYKKHCKTLEVVKKYCKKTCNLCPKIYTPSSKKKKGKKKKKSKKKKKKSKKKKKKSKKKPKKTRSDKREELDIDKLEFESSME